MDPSFLPLLGCTLRWNILPLLSLNDICELRCTCSSVRDLVDENKDISNAFRPYLVTVRKNWHAIRFRLRYIYDERLFFDVLQIIDESPTWFRRWFLRYVLPVENVFCYTWSETIFNLCMSKNLHWAKWLSDHPRAPETIPPHDLYTTHIEHQCLMVQSGAIDELDWLMENNYICTTFGTFDRWFAIAVASGNMTMVKWAHLKGITTGAMLCGSGYGLKMASWKGHYEVVEWLIQHQLIQKNHIVPRVYITKLYPMYMDEPPEIYNKTPLDLSSGRIRSLFLDILG